MEMDIIDDYEAIRLLINIYMFKRLKSSFRPVKQEKFIEDVCKKFKERSFSYTTKSILFTWKHLLDNYQFYKKNFTDENAKKEWKYFDLMDNCFEYSTATSEKFTDPKWTLFLIESVSQYRPTVLKHGLNVDILQAVEDDFHKQNNYEVTQKDIYTHWLNLKKVYKKYLSNSSYKFSKSYLYYSALTNFFEGDISEQVRSKTVASVSQNELDTAIASITSTDQNSKRKKRKTDLHNKVVEPLPISSSKDVDILPNREDFAEFTPFTVVMHDILLQCFKRNKKKIRHLSGGIDDDTLNEVFDEFKKLGYTVTKASICNEWNDLTCRYELIKNTEQPQKWPYYNDIHYIFTDEDIEYDICNTDLINDANSECNVEALLEKNIENTQKITRNEVEISEKLLNIYECNNKEFLEIKDTLVERNLLREETNYLLNLLLEKFNKRKTE